MTNQIAVLKFRVFAVAAICALAALVAFASAASATPGTQDQAYLPSLTGGYDVYSASTIAQSFTVGLSGTLTDVALQISNDSFMGTPSPLTVEIVTLNAGVPDPTHVVASGSVTASELTGTHQLIDVPLSPEPAVTVGQQYAVVAESSTGGGTSFGIWWNFANGYASGTGWQGSSASSLSDTGDDFAFATYVTPAATSSPAGPRGAYCTVAGNTTDIGQPLFPGTFVNLDDGQATGDPHYNGAVPANFVKGVGLTCGPVPAGFTQHGYATADMNVDANTYPYYSN